MKTHVCLFLFLLTVDTQPPVITSCPHNIHASIELGEDKRQVHWTEPLAYDASNNVSLLSYSHYLDDFFMVGKTDVRYTFVDGSGNVAHCDFSITLSPGKKQQPKLKMFIVLIVVCIIVCCATYSFVVQTLITHDAVAAVRGFCNPRDQKYFSPLQNSCKAYPQLFVLWFLKSSFF